MVVYYSILHDVLVMAEDFGSFISVDMDGARLLSKFMDVKHFFDSFSVDLTAIKDNLGTRKGNLMYCNDILIYGYSRPDSMRFYRIGDKYIADMFTEKFSNMGMMGRLVVRADDLSFVGGIQMDKYYMVNETPESRKLAQFLKQSKEIFEYDGKLAGR